MNTVNQFYIINEENLHKHNTNNSIKSDRRYWTYHEGVVERGEDVGDGEVLLTLSELALNSGDFLDFLSRCFGLNIKKHMSVILT